MSGKNLVLSFDAGSSGYTSTYWKDVPDRIDVTITQEFLEKAKRTVEWLTSEGQNSVTYAGLKFEAYDENEEGEYVEFDGSYALHDADTIILSNGSLKLSLKISLPFDQTNDRISIELGTIAELEDKMNTEHGDNHSPAI